MVLYLLICLISVFAGCGILAVIGLDVHRRNTLFLAPVVTLCFVAILMGGLVAGGFTVGEITPAMYTLCFGSAILGGIRHGRLVLASWRSLLILVALPLLILLPSIIQGIQNYSGGLCMDGWSYVTLGQSLQQYPLGSDGWFPVNVQYSAVFGRATRFISCAFLALFAPLSGKHNDTQEVLGHYLSWLFFLYGSACLFFAKAIRLTRPMTWIFLFLATLTGWTLKIINANSVDNALALCLLPAGIGILVLMPGPSIRYGIVLGTIVAAVLYAYPESSPFAVAAIAAMAAQRAIAAPQQLQGFGRMAIALVTTVGFCILPYALEIASFFRYESTLARGAVGVRPGEPFYHSLSRSGYILQSYWGLTPDFDGRLLGETYLRNYNAYVDVVACLLSLIALLGVLLLLWRRQWTLPVFAIAMTASYAISLIHLRYPYAAYKILVLTWFVIVYLVAVAAEWVWEKLGFQSSRGVRYLASGIAVILAVIIAGSFFLQEQIFYDSLPFKSLREFKKVSVVENLAGRSAVAMIVNETYANIWCMHFLRDLKLYLAGQYRGYMVGYAAKLDRSELVSPADIRFAVTDNEHSMERSRLLSKIGPYYVWDCRRTPWVLLTEINNPNGVEGGGSSEPFIWIGRGDTELRILSPSVTSAVISAQFTLGPSLPERTRQRMLVKVENFEEELTIQNGEQSFTVPLQPGLNHVTLLPLEKATTFLPNDPRPLLIHAAHISVSIPQENESAQIREIENPNGLESWFGKEPFFWMGTRDTVVTISSSESGVAQLTATLLPGPSLADKSVARLSILPAVGDKIKQNLNWGPAEIDVPVHAGLNKIVMNAVGPNVIVSHRSHITDRRTMMIGFRNLQASYRRLH